VTPANDRQHDADILILGAGPAGCAAAISARLAGMSVTLLQARHAPHRVPGETLHPGVETLFKSLGVWETVLDQRFHRHRGIWRDEVDGQRRFEAYGSDDSGPWLGFQVDRAILNRILQSRTEDLGGNILRVSKLDRVVVNGDRSVTGVSADGKVCTSRFVLDATGRHAWLAGRLGLIPESTERPQRIRFGWSRIPVPELDSQPLFQMRRDGWNWLSPLGDGRCAWVKLRRGSTFRGLDYSWRIFRACAGPGYFLLGDAACLMDPSAANGVLRAVMSGMYAVHLFSAAERGRATPGQAAAEYKSWVAGLFDQTRKELHAAETSWSQAEGF